MRASYYTRHSAAQQLGGTVPVSVTVTASYNIIQQVFKTVTTSYIIKTAVQRFLGQPGNAPTYVIRQAITKILNVSQYKINQRITKTLSPSYSIHSLPVFLVNPVITGTPLSGQILHEDGGTLRADPVDTITRTDVWQVETAPGSGVYADMVAETAVDLQI